MVIPISTSVMREVFSQAPPGEKEGALALGGTRWGMIRTVVLPFGRGGIIGGSMLGLGRALGETIAVADHQPDLPDPPNILEAGANSIAALIANRFGESDGDRAVGADGRRVSCCSLMTLIVNTIASIDRRAIPLGLGGGDLR